MFRHIVLSSVLVLGGFVSDALAQSDRSVWGFSGSFVPKWNTPSELAILFDADTVDIRGSEFRVGVVRGRPLSGDWGVSFVRKNFREGSQVSAEPFEGCFNTSCFTETSSATFQHVTVTGVEVHKFIPFATIKRRAQIGLTVAGGVGSWKGTALREEAFVDFQGNTPVLRRDVASIPIEDLWVLERAMIPLFRLELAGAAIVSNNFKMRISGGVNFPGTQAFSVQGIFLLPQ